MNPSRSAHFQTEPSPDVAAAPHPLRPNARSTERGPSNRTLAIVAFTALTLAIVLLFAMPKPAPHEVRFTGTPEAPPPASQVVTPDTRVQPPPALEPSPTVSAGQADSIVKPVSAVSSVPVQSRQAVQVEQPRQENARNDVPPKVVDLTRSEPIAAASARPAADLIVAPPPARVAETPGGSAGGIREEVATRQERAERSAIGATDQAAPVRTAEPQPVPVPAPASE